ncbi:MAG: membrane complex biogenesis protein, BtpA family, partial [uncultured archaeon A07HR60]
MVHLEPLPGAPGGHSIEDVLTAAKRDVGRLESGGVDALMIENFGDAPFYPDSVPKHVIATMTRIITELQDTTTLPLGVNVLRNDARGAVSIAAATDIDFIRINVHVGARVTDQGIVEGTAHDTLRLREELGASVRLFADV